MGQSKLAYGSNGLSAALLATVQRGQEVDKSIMNAATYLYVCQHNTEDDTRYMAKKLGVSTNKIPTVPLQFMIWRQSKGEVASGNVKFNRQSKPEFLKKGAGAKRLGISSVCGVFNGMVYS